MSSNNQWKAILKGARETIFYLFVITIILTIITPVFFVISLSFLSTHDAYSYPLPILPTFSKTYELSYGERGYLIKVYDRTEQDFVSILDSDDFEKMAVYLKSRMGTPISVAELEYLAGQLEGKEQIYFRQKADLLHNYRTFFQITRDATSALIRSLQICGLTILVSLSIGGLAGYAFARYFFVGRDLLKFSVLFVRMFPAISIALPMVIVLADIGFYDRPIGLSIVYSIGSIALTVWITASIFMGIPVSLEEAAQVFGATKFQSFMRVTLPLSLPGLAAAAMYAFLGAWNETVAAIILTQFNPTFSVVVYQSLVGATGQINLAAAGGMIMAIPSILFTFFIRKYIQQMWGGVTI
jgi:multiple sugar transport system permease protein